MWQRMEEAAADLLLGRTCSGCGRPGPLLCPACLDWLDSYGPRVVRPRPTPPGLPMTTASAPYAGPMRRIVHRYKEASAWGLADVLADRLALAVLALLHRCLEDGLWEPGPVVLAPAPSRRAAVLKRGSDVTARFTALAAGRVGAVLGRPVTSRALVRMSPRTVDQAGLGADARMVNLSGRLAVRTAAVDREVTVVPVDDVITTGATMTELTRVLRGAGVRVLGAATVAATPRRISEGAGRVSRPAPTAGGGPR